MTLLRNFFCFPPPCSKGGGGAEIKLPHRPNGLPHRPLVLCSNLPIDSGHFDEVHLNSRPNFEKQK